MQMKSSSSMEKRGDLASLFCMIGRHGPAVAVAVIAVVSVLAGFIIYRNVKGKRRRAAADRDGESRRPQRVESLQQLDQDQDQDQDQDPEPEQESSLEESTGVSHKALTNINAEPSSTRLRNRGAAAKQKPLPHCPPKTDLEPDEENASLVPNSHNVAESCAEEANKSLEGHDDTGTGIDGGCQKDLIDSSMKDEGEEHDGCLKPAVICESPEEKVTEPQENENVMDDSREIKYEKEAPVCLPNTPLFYKQSTLTQKEDGLKDEMTPDMKMKSNVEELMIHMDKPTCGKDAEVKMEDFHVDGIEFSENDHECPSLQEELTNEECIDDRLITLQHETKYCALAQTKLPSSLQDEYETVTEQAMQSTEDNQDADCSRACEVREENVDGGLTSVDMSKLKPEDEGRDDSSYNQQRVIEAGQMPSFCGEELGSSSVVLGSTRSCLNQSVESENNGDNGLYSPETGLNSGPDHNLKEIQSEENDGGAVEFECFIHLASSSERNPASAACEKVVFPAPVTSIETSHADALTCLQEQKIDQMQHIEDLSDVATGPAPDLTESIMPSICQIQPFTFDQSELTWSAGVDEESGISSMTVSPDLQDPYECDIIPKNLAPSEMDCPKSEEQSEARSRFFTNEDVSITKDDTVGVVLEPGSSQPSHQCQSEETGHKSPTLNEGSCHRVIDQFMTPDDNGLAGKLKQDVERKSEAVKSKKEVAEKEDHVKTEISIMEATMDNNEWITDGNCQVNPLINVSAASSAQNTQADVLCMKETHSAPLPVNATFTNVDIKLTTEVKNDAFSLTDKGTENAKKIVAVQPIPQNVNVMFRIHYLTQSPYQKVAVTGNQQELGNWKGFVPLERSKDGHWATVVSLPAESHVEWKFVVVDKGEVCRWEECGNRLLETGYGDDLFVHKWWGFL